MLISTQLETQEGLFSFQRSLSAQFSPCPVNSRHLDLLAPPARPQPRMTIKLPLGFLFLQPVRQYTGVIVSVSSFVSPPADPCPALSNVQSLQTIISHNLFSFILVSAGGVNLVSVTLSWLKEDFYQSSNETRQISNPK